MRRQRRAPADENLSSTARLETFADGVMAIAITLLILEVRVPHLEADSEAGASLARALGQQWPSYAAYTVSFLTIAIIWVNHHHMFTLIERTTHTFLVWNVVFLMTIAALPWPTALAAEYIRDEVHRTTAALVYGGTMVAIAIMFNVVWRYASIGHRLLRDGVNPVELARINRSYLVGPVVYALATMLALVNPWISFAVYAALALYYLLPGTGPRSRRLLVAPEGSAPSGR